jgi:hypothetical protein
MLIEGLLRRPWRAKWQPAEAVSELGYTLLWAFAWIVAAALLLAPGGAEPAGRDSMHAAP